jgi:hypothetical protein
MVHISSAFLTHLLLMILASGHIITLRTKVIAICGLTLNVIKQPKLILKILKIDFLSVELSVIYMFGASSFMLNFVKQVSKKTVEVDSVMSEPINFQGHLLLSLGLS